MGQVPDSPEVNNKERFWAKVTTLGFPMSSLTEELGLKGDKSGDSGDS